MRIEGEYHRRTRDASRALDEPPGDFRMTQVHSVKVPDRRGAAAQFVG